MRTYPEMRDDVVLNHLIAESLVQYLLSISNRQSVGQLLQQVVGLVGKVFKRREVEASLVEDIVQGA